MIPTNHEIVQTMARKHTRADLLSRIGILERAKELSTAEMQILSFMRKAVKLKPVPRTAVEMVQETMEIDGPDLMRALTDVD